MFAISILQDLTADDDKIELAVTKFRKAFEFTLTYVQENHLLNQKLRLGIIRFSNSPIERCVNAYLKKIPFFTQTFDESNDFLSLSNEVFRIGPNFKDSRIQVPVYYKAFLKYDNKTQAIACSDWTDICFLNNRTTWTMHVSEDLNKVIFDGTPKKPIKMTFVIGVL
ncbi:unnamed protein product [Ambrosiozyma monospora]|uniref:Unnamed protein product n=1 Tax=Ambrosiozyma monospora TaxID=43982 RepID=A0ACB5U168_AMBMO|nr:unnamed protein product [Ambrosiozyma monospora]